MKQEENLKEMVFKDYYASLPDDAKETIRNLILQKSGMSYPTFYYKLRNNSFKPLELNMIKELIGSLNGIESNVYNIENITNEVFEKLKETVYDPVKQH